jgi:hypothetical protein
MGGTLTNEINIQLNSIDVYELIQIPDGTLRIYLNFENNGIEEEYESILSSLDFFSLNKVVYTGKNTSTNNTEVIDSDVSKDFDETINTTEYIVRILTDNNKGIFRKIKSLENNKITVEDSFPSNLSNGSKFEILKMPTINEIIIFLNLRLQNNSSDLFIKNNVYFSYNNYLFLNTYELTNENRKVNLTISDSNIFGTQLSSYCDFDPNGETKSSK